MDNLDVAKTVYENLIGIRQQSSAHPFAKSQGPPRPEPDLARNYTAEGRKPNERVKEDGFWKGRLTRPS